MKKLSIVLSVLILLVTGRPLLCAGHQLNNLAGNEGYSRTEKKLEKLLQKTLKDRKDEFRPGMEYIKKWDYMESIKMKLGHL